MAIILFLPIILDKRILNGHFKIMFDQSSIDKSRHLGEIYKIIAEKTKCKIFDINKFAQTSDIDGLHYTVETHKIIAEALIKLFFN